MSSSNPGTILSSSHSPIVLLYPQVENCQFSQEWSCSCSALNSEQLLFRIVSSFEGSSMWPPWGHQRRDKWHEHIRQWSPLSFLISSFSLWVRGKESHAVSGHRAGGNEQMATNEIFVFRSVLNRSYILAICRSWRGDKNLAKSYKLNPITVACGHKKGPTLGRYCLLHATLATRKN